MKPTRATSILAAVLFAAALAAAVPAAAGEQYVDATGYAVSGYDVVAYFDMAQAPVGAAQPDPVPGRADITAAYNGATFAFANAANRDRFLADPARYAPAYDGHCAYGVAVGNKVPANPALWRVVEGRLYLNITEDVAQSWSEDIPGYVAQSEANWREVELKPAADDPVPDFDPNDAPQE